MNVFAALLLGHLIGDFPLQFGWVYRFKTRHPAGIALHAGIHVLITALLIREPARHWPVLLVLGLVHFAIDWIKLRVPTNPQAPGFLIDQAAHLATIALIAGAAGGLDAVLPPSLLYPSLWLALIPAAMMLLWITACDQCRQAPHPGGFVGWARRRMLSLSQVVGLPIAAGLTLTRLIAL